MHKYYAQINQFSCNLRYDKPKILYMDCFAILPQFAFQAIALHAHCGYKSNPSIKILKSILFFYGSTWFEYIQKTPSCNRTGYKSRLPPLTLRTPAMHLIRASLNAGTTANSTWLIFLPFDLQLRSDIHLHLTCICISPSQTLFDFLTQTTVSVTVFMVLFIF